MSRAKQVGTAHETAIKLYLIAVGYRFAKRIVLRGGRDEGDLTLGDGYPVVVEAKAGRGVLSRIPQSLDELETEITNADAEFGFVVMKRRGTTDVGKYYALVPMHRMMWLISRVWPPPPPHTTPVRKPRTKMWPPVR